MHGASHFELWLPSQLLLPLCFFAGHSARRVVAAPLLLPAKPLHQPPPTHPPTHTAPFQQDIDSLTANFQQLKDAQARFAESANSLLALPTDGVARDVMVPLTASLYVPGKLGALDEVLVDIGTGYYVGKTAPAAAEMLNRKAAVVKGNAEQLMKVRRVGWCCRCGLHVDACASESARARGQGSVPAGSFALAARAHAPSSRTPCTDPGTTSRDIAEHGR